MVIIMVVVVSHRRRRCHRHHRGFPLLSFWPLGNQLRSPLPDLTQELFLTLLIPNTWQPALALSLCHSLATSPGACTWGCLSLPEHHPFQLPTHTEKKKPRHPQCSRKDLRLNGSCSRNSPLQHWDAHSLGALSYRPSIARTE